MAMWLSSQNGAWNGRAAVDPVALKPDIGAYRAAVADLIAELIGRNGPVSPLSAERILARRLRDPELTAVLTATPQGMPGFIRRLLREVRTYQPRPGSSAHDLAMLIRIAMLAQIDMLWWGHVPAYRTDEDVLDAAELMDLDALRLGGLLRFRYRHEAETLLGRAARSAERRVWPGRTPRTAGLRIARTRPQVVAMLNQLSAEFAAHAPAGTPPVWVTSLTRSVEHQHHLRALGYAALLPSSHCVGYAVDIEMAWFRRHHAHRLLRGLLQDLHRAGEINVIDEGQVWHACVRPPGRDRLRLVKPARGED